MAGMAITLSRCVYIDYPYCLIRLSQGKGVGWLVHYGEQVGHHFAGIDSATLMANSGGSSHWHTKHTRKFLSRHAHFRSL